ncbi:MAG TPA: cobalamin-dependent protein [Solirubrobacterales bacterium]
MSSPASAELLPVDLPDSAELIREGREIGSRLVPAQTRYDKRHGVVSERFYKERCREDGTITYYINLGLKAWPETRDALGEVWEECQRRNLRVDRVSLTSDRRMGLMPEDRPGAVEETGIMFWTPEDWAGVATETELQGIYNDHAVGSPASVFNACAAIEAGIAYVGNIAQQSYGYPGWSSDVEEMANTVKAIAVIAAQKGAGVVLDSYIDDGYCGSFHDCATSLAWCLLHRRIAEELIGAAYSPSFGSTFADPALKAAFGQALDAINSSRVPPSLVHGDTNSLDPSFSLDRHAATTTTDIFFTIANQLAHPTGAAVHPTPTTEPIRIPTVEDIIQSLELGNEAERQARRALPMIDWRPVYAIRDRIIAGGRQVYANMLEGLAGLGIDIDDPLQLLVSTRRLGAERIEQLWGAGPADPEYPRGRAPVVATNTLSRATATRRAVLEEILAESDFDLAGVKVVAASSDVHEYGLDVVVSILRHFGAEVVDLGTSVDNDLIAAAAAETAADAIGLSTYNGSALSVAKGLMEQLRERALLTEVFVGGRLIQDLGSVKSVDVSDRIEDLGAHPCATVRQMLDALGALEPSRN